MMEATLIFKNIRPKSKQHSGGQRGKFRFVDKKYGERLAEFRAEAWKQLLAQGWKTARTENVHLTIWLLWPFVLGDDENMIGIVLDALEGAAYEDDCQARLTGGIRAQLSPCREVIVHLKLGEADDYVTEAIRKAKGRLKSRVMRRTK